MKVKCAFLINSYQYGCAATEMSVQDLCGLQKKATVYPSSKVENGFRGLGAVGAVGVTDQLYPGSTLISTKFIKSLWRAASCVLFICFNMCKI